MCKILYTQKFLRIRYICWMGKDKTVKRIAITKMGLVNRRSKQAGATIPVETRVVVNKAIRILP